MFAAVLRSYSCHFRFHTSACSASGVRSFIIADVIADVNAPPLLHCSSPRLRILRGSLTSKPGFSTFTSQSSSSTAFAITLTGRRRRSRKRGMSNAARCWRLNWAPFMTAVRMQQLEIIEQVTASTAIVAIMTSISGEQRSMHRRTRRPRRRLQRERSLRLRCTHPMGPWNQEPPLPFQTRKN